MTMAPVNLLAVHLQACIDANASDLHLSVGMPPMLRVHGELNACSSVIQTAQMLHSMTHALLKTAQLEGLEQQRSVDTAYTHHDHTRFRLNIYYERNQLAIAARRLDSRLRSLNELRLPDSLRHTVDYPHGLVLVTGATGSGKSTTLATLIDSINRQRACHILTIEDPIEFLHSPQRAIIHQRELHLDVNGYAQAIRDALRQDPDVLLVGEMRDLETMRAAIAAAETGHLVFSTLHTGDAVGAISRIVGSFPAAEQVSIRQQLSRVLRLVVTQRLLPSLQQQRVVCAEVLTVNTAIANLIRSDKAEQIYALMETGANEGMLTLEAALAELVQQRLISEENALREARNSEALQRYLRASTTGTVSSSRRWA